MTDLYGKPSAYKGLEEDGYTSSEEYADQGDTRVTRDLLFSYLVAHEDPVTNVAILNPVSVPRDTELNVEDIGLIALRKGEENHSFYTTKELDAINNPLAGIEGVDLASANIADLGEFELAEWLATGNDGGPFTINEVLERVGDDKELAHRMLQAENIRSDSDPRKGLEDGLSAIIRGA